MKAEKGKILIVEDEAVVRESLKEWLLEDGYDVECASTGKEAFIRCSQHRDNNIYCDCGVCLAVPAASSAAPF